MNACVLSVSLLGPFHINENLSLPALHLCCFCPVHPIPGTFMLQNSEKGQRGTGLEKKEKGKRVLCPSRPGSLL